MNPVIINGYDSEWYPKLESVIPRIYHQYALSEEELKDIYTDDEIKNIYKNAYFASSAKDYPSIGFNGAKVQYINICGNGVKLVPTDKTKDNVIQKMTIKNTSDKNEYVRIHIAIPTILDDGDPSFNAKANTLHFNSPDGSLDLGKFNWGKDLNRQAGKYTSGEWNFYKTIINGISYNVYVVTHEDPIAPGETTIPVIVKVYMDSKCTEDTVANINKNVFKSNKWQMYAVAEAIFAPEDAVDRVEDPDPDAYAEKGEVVSEAASTEEATSTEPTKEENGEDGKDYENMTVFELFDTIYIPSENQNPFKK